jgi:hypothetical protein
VYLAAVICVLMIGAGLALYSANRSSSVASVPKPAASTTVPVTVPYGATAGPQGTKILTERVDPLRLAVPAGWLTPSPDQETLPVQIDAFAQQAPPLASLLYAEGHVATEAAIRVFAYQPTAPAMFVCVVSYSTPGSKALTPAAAAAVVTALQRKPSKVGVTSAQLPAGSVVELYSAFVSQKQPVLVEDVLLVATGRTMLIEMVGETNGVSPPAVFGQIAQSLRLY